MGYTYRHVNIENTTQFLDRFSNLFDGIFQSLQTIDFLRRWRSHYYRGDEREH